MQRASLVVLLWLISGSAWAQKEGIAVNLSDWGVRQPPEIRGGLLTQDSQGGSYVAELQGPPRAQPAPPFYQPLQGPRGLLASPGSRATWEDSVLHFDQQPGGFCGFWMRLDSPADLRASEFFVWARGTGRLVVKAADPLWQQRQDGIEVVRAPLQAGWTRLRAPWPAGLDASQVVSVSFLVEGEGSLEISSACAVAPETPGPAPPPSAAVAPALRPACWIWDTQDRLARPDRSWETFLLRQGIGTVFVQIPRQLDDDLGHLVCELRTQGLQVHALFGDRHDVLAEGRRASLARLDELLRWQDTRPEQERFQGLHVDVEPYLLGGFAGARRQHLLTLYLYLMEEIEARAHQAGIPAGFDIPCWYDQGPALELAGVSQLAHQHILERADAVALMSYRTSAEGVLQCSQSEREWAARLHKPLWLGLETESLPDEVSFRFAGTPRRGQAHSQEVLLVVDEAGQGQFVLGPDPRGGWVWPIVAEEKSPARNLTFSAWSEARLEEVRGALQTQVLPFAMAIHHLGSWMQLVSR